ncbi:bactoprenol glucosyl transferase [Enterovibrio norvegicus FF-162]|uniref:Bactoprenol glucosyl transferase n=1 Tax=Enterovibrio norvegicus FF-454 TaxID=1185651 RepID=A0A1E5CFV2_9GAMM|nr:glycosyltransferase family 2 protein [Enterovibrio norvegicus]OEE64391.1 bactoprenol glucosyl transferase [Enterovibrio norvegicus FF-454]OEE74575.1 bactoprenol glucosyl transferase [Enterovibrio norvegicus FF-162]
MTQTVISIVCPCFNEQEVIHTFTDKITGIMSATDFSYELLFVNDGSKDNTLSVLHELAAKNTHIRVLNLSRNFGKEAALTAGLDHAKGEVIIPIDADLQDPPELIHDFLREWQKGYDVVVAKRIDRSSDTLAKKITASLFYKFHNSIADVEIPDNVGDFRLITRRVVQAIQLLPENQRFMKGIFSWVGFKTSVVEYARQPRAAGESSFNGWRLWNFALEGITSFSTAPLRVWLYLGVFISTIAFVFGSAIILKTLMFGVDLPGYASLLTIVLFFGGMQLIGLGVMGEYIGRLYMESKRRPVYILENDSAATDTENNNNDK